MNKASLFFLLLLGCKSVQGPEQTPKAINHEIEVFAATATCKDASVKQMEFQDKRVFIFEEGSCVMDKESRVLDEKGKLLGNLGGFSGNMIISGDDFSKAVFIREVWRKSPLEPNQ